MALSKSASAELASKDTPQGTYYFLTIETMLELFKEAGFDMEADPLSEEIPSQITIDHKHYYFLGETAEIEGVVREVVLVSETFDFQNLEDPTLMDLEDEDTPPLKN